MPDDSGLGNLNQFLGIVNQILQDVQKLNDLRTYEQDTREGLAAINLQLTLQGTILNKVQANTVALSNQIKAFSDRMGSELNAISAEIEAIPLSTTPPSWYTAPPPIDTGAIASAFLAATLNVSEWCVMDPSITVEAILRNLYQSSLLQTYGNGTQWVFYPGMTLHGCTPDDVLWVIHPPDPVTWPTFLPPDISWTDYSGGSLSAFLNGVDPDPSWQTTSTDTGPGAWSWKRANAWFGNSVHWICRAPEVSIERSVSTSTTTIETVIRNTGAPVWPGLDAVTLGTTLDLVDGLVVPGPLDGVILEVTGHPARAGAYKYGTVNAWRWLGQILFRDSDGRGEWPISIGPEKGVVTPRSMARAADAVLRMDHPFTGTITPWLTAGGA